MFARICNSGHWHTALSRDKYNDSDRLFLAVEEYPYHYFGIILSHLMGIHFTHIAIYRDPRTLENIYTLAKISRQLWPSVLLLRGLDPS